MSCDVTILAPDATAIVQDQDGNELARENIASGATVIITVNVGNLAPNPPTNLQVTNIEDTTATLTWDAATDN